MISTYSILKEIQMLGLLMKVVTVVIAVIEVAGEVKDHIDG